MRKIKFEKTFILSQEEELKKITTINFYLKTLEKEIEDIENILPFETIIWRGSAVSELMVKLYLEKEGFEINNNKTITFGHIIHFCDNENLLPKEIIKFLNTIRNNRNLLVHGGLDKNYEINEAYLEALNYFLIWFNEFYSKEYSIKKPFRINQISSLIQSLSAEDLINDNFAELEEESENLEIQVKRLSNEMNLMEHKKLIKSIKANNNLMSPISKSLTPNQGEKRSKRRSPASNHYERKENYQDFEEELKVLEEKIEQTLLKQSQINDKKTMQALENLAKKLEIFEKKLDELSKTAQRIEEKVDTILNIIDSKMDTLQSFISDQINDLTSKEDVEKIMTNFTNNYVENIAPDYYKKISKKEEFEKEKKKLIYSLGEDAWDKLSDKSQTFLVTSKVMYNDLIMVDNISDFSGVCILVTKALEVEMFNRFCTDFKKYLKKKYGKNYSKYHSSLIHTSRDNKKNVIFNKNFYMGTVVFILSPKKNKYGKKHQIEHDEKVILDYCEKCIFSNKNEKEIQKTLDEYANDIETIKDKYRNPSAHRNEIQRVNAEECFNLVLDVEKLLKKMLDSFDY